MGIFVLWEAYSEVADRACGCDAGDGDGCGEVWHDNYCVELNFDLADSRLAGSDETIIVIDLQSMCDTIVKTHRLPFDDLELTDGGRGREIEGRGGHDGAP